MPELHARLGPSNHRWPHCPGSVREEAKYPDVPGEAAIDGTGSHLLLELCLQNGVRAETYDRQVIGVNHPDSQMGWRVDDQRAARVQLCLDYVHARVKNLRNEFPGCSVKVYAEAKADPGLMFGRSDWWGTCDVTILVTNRHGHCLLIEIIDYKDGQGWVEVKDNTQLISYLVGQLAPFGLENQNTICRTCIVQPKTNKPIRTHDYKMSELKEKALWLRDRAIATDAPDAPLIPDDKGGKGYCKWCSHNPKRGGTCDAHANRDIERLTSMSETQLPAVAGENNLMELGAKILGNIKEQPAEKLTEFMEMEPGITGLFDRIREEIQRRIVEEGQEVSGWAMLPGRASRVWALSADELEKKLKGRRLNKTDIYQTTLKSPAQLQKLEKLSKEQWARIEEEFVVEKPSADKLQRVAHQPAKKQDVQQMFALDFSAPPVRPRTATEFDFSQPIDFSVPQ